MTSYPNDQGNPAAAIPVYVVSGGSSPSPLTPLGYQQITSLSGATLLTAPAGAKTAFIDVSGAAVRWRDDGSAPTASVGMPVANGASLQYSGSLAAIQFIQQSASAILDISYYK